MQVYSALHASPLTPHAAAAAGLITGARYKADALQTLLHSTQAGGDPAAVLAAKPASVIEEVVTTITKQSREGKAARAGKAPVRADSIPDASETTPDTEHSPADSTTAVHDSTKSVSHAASVLARIQEANLAGPSNQRAAMVTDKKETTSVTRTNLISMRKYIQVTCPASCTVHIIVVKTRSKGFS